MLSCCAFAQADPIIFVSRSSKFYRSKHQRHSLVNNGSSDQTTRVLAVRIMAKNYVNYVRIRRFIFDSACAGLSLSPLLS